ncbi:MAG: xylulokinase [Spirochaetes bacterium GWF1_41_5]|nr:MAG: xylulokinase [Spirochaetes bacterium GWF1_41_5]HBE01340.1 xylulokinase [Spirochaetia bacterium]
MKELLLGIDFGTGGCKGTLVSAAGKIITEHACEYKTSHPQAGWCEQNPDDWKKAMAEMLSVLLSGINPPDISAIAFDGSTHNAVLLDKNLAVLRPVIMWTDQRSSLEAEELGKNHGTEIFSKTLALPSPTWTLPQMLWLHKNEPEILKKTSHILFVKDYMRFLLTGLMQTDYIEAQGTMFFLSKDRKWSGELCRLGAVPFSALPEIINPADICGKTTESAGEFNLPAGIPVVCGTSDSAAEAFSAGAVRPGQCILKLATAGNVNVITENAVPGEKTLTYSHPVPGLWYSVAATNSAAAAERWLRDTFFSDYKADESWSVIDKEAALSPAGSGGIIFHPYLLGERSPYWDKNLRASFTGISMRSGRGDFCRSLMEGVAFSLADCFTVIKKLGLNPQEFRLIGGGSKSSVWPQIVADVFGKPLVLPASSSASLGAAMLAGCGIKVFKDEISAAGLCVKEKNRIIPGENTENYQKIFKNYLAIHDALAPVYKNIFE